MSDIKISLPGSETVTITGQNIDKLIRAGDGDAALLYLYTLKTQGQKTLSEAATALDKGKGCINSASIVLKRLGLVNLSDGDVERNPDDVTKPENNTGSGSPLEEPRQYTESEVKRELSAGSGFSIVVDETQRKLGKILTQDELTRLLSIYDYLRLPPEVIMLLITHCIKECRKSGDGRAPSVRYIEKAAHTWEREGVFTLEKAEEYLKALEERKSIRGEIKRILQIRDRDLSATEKRYVDEWIDMGFKPDVIAIAYDRTMVKKSNMNWPYMDGIMKNWHNSKIFTLEQVMESDGSQRKGSGGAGAAGANDAGANYRGVNASRANMNTSAQKHGEPSREEMERMRRLSNKIKEE